MLWFHFIHACIMYLLPPTNEVCEGYVFTRVCHCVHGGGGWYPSMHCRWYPSMPCSRSRGAGILACLAGFLANTQGGSWGVYPGGSLGPHLGGSPGSDPGGCLQAHTWGVSPGPQLGGARSTPKGGCVPWHALRQTPSTATAAGGTHPTGMHSCWFVFSANVFDFPEHFACERENLNLECPQGQLLNITAANFGRRVSTQMIYRYVNRATLRIGVFPRWIRNSVNSANSGNLINQWSMNWALCYLCLAGAVVITLVSHSLTQEVAGLNNLLKIKKKFNKTQRIQWKHLEITQLT